MYEQFLQVGQMYRTLILRGLALYVMSAFIFRYSWCYKEVVKRQILPGFNSHCQPNASKINKMNKISK